MARSFEEMRDRIIDAQNELTAMKQQYLRDAGWEYRCDIPGARWHWQKKLADGRVVLVSADSALQIEGVL